MNRFRPPHIFKGFENLQTQLRSLGITYGPETIWVTIVPDAVEMQSLLEISESVDTSYSSQRSVDTKSSDQETSNSQRPLEDYVFGSDGDKLMRTLDF